MVIAFNTRHTTSENPPDAFYRQIAVFAVGVGEPGKSVGIQLPQFLRNGQLAI